MPLRLVHAALLVLLLAAVQPHSSPLRAAPLPQAQGDVAAQEAAMLERINAARREAGLAPYRSNATLAGAARAHAQEIATHEHFSHTGLDGRSAKQRVIDTGYGAGREGLRVGENFVGRATVDEAFGWLMEDPPHRANVLHPDYLEIGVGVAAIRWGWIYVMDAATYAGLAEELAAGDVPTALPPSPSMVPPTATEPAAAASPTREIGTPEPGQPAPSATVTLAPVQTQPAEDPPGEATPSATDETATPPEDPGADEGETTDRRRRQLAFLLLVLVAVSSVVLARRR